MRVYVGVTDTRWYEYLAAQPQLSEVNFWRPGGAQAFRALQVGEPFLFKTRFPANRIVGGGFFSGFTRLRLSEAWDIYGRGNGMPDEHTMIEAIRGYRNGSTEPSSEIGCVFLRDVRFFDAIEQLPAPTDFARNIVQGRTYETDALPEDHEVARALFWLAAPGVYTRLPASIDGPMFGAPGSTARRLGQQAFRAMVTAGYSRRCAITGDRIQPALQAAHIRPVEAGGEHRLDNGVLLRSDVHIMFDRGYLGIDERHRLRVSPRLRSEFGNGDVFYERAGREIALPVDKQHRPARQFLEWHADTVFLH